VAAVAWLAGTSAYLALAALPIALWVYVLAFFRDPDRRIPDGPGLMVSPADGRVADITRVGPDSPLGRDGVKIGVFMSVFNCHVNRSPVDGTIESIEHTVGSFLDVRKAEAIERNEAATIRMTCRRGGVEYPLLVRQIAGLVARRIVTDLVEGQAVRRGRRIGMIKFGSRLELWAPAELVGAVLVREGQVVRAGQSVLLAEPRERQDE
jgi:phosphatidylserine decarboxylase